MVRKVSSIIGVGKRKMSIARARIIEGTGIVRVNKIVLEESPTPELNKLLIKEPLMLSSDKSLKVDINVTVKGGGVNGQAQAVRTAIGNALVKFFKKDKDLRKTLITYDRSILVSDTRRKEMCKPYRSKARARRQKSKR